MEKILSSKEKCFLEHAGNMKWCRELSQSELLTAGACKGLRDDYFAGFEDCQVLIMKILEKHKVEINIKKEIFNLDEKPGHY